MVSAVNGIGSLDYLLCPRGRHSFYALCEKSFGSTRKIYRDEVPEIKDLIRIKVFADYLD